MDMLVNLSRLPSLEEEIKKMNSIGVKIAKAFPANREHILDFVKSNFSTYQVGEVASCFCKSSPTMYVATRGLEIIGFACYNATAPDFFGPTEVLEKEQGKGIGRALLIASLQALKNEGYGYAIIGSIGPAKFYEKTVNAVMIEDSKIASLYDDMIALDD